ncbi:MAG TPA: hypothetical protein VG738_23600 [Chitinophagaceae bacterium]|nr:hypothetical protein [Chitinophagaceae bacterium]
MKKLFLSFILVLFVSASYACPFCGCGGGNLYMGLLPDFQHGFVGVRYHYSQYHTVLLSDPSQYSTNYYNSIELWGGYSISKKIQLLAFVPYYSNKQVDDDGTTTPSGMGDISLLAQYRVFSVTSLSPNKRVIQQQMWLGGGVKLATGNFNLDLSDPDVTVADINAQLGTGSTDFLLNGFYSVRIENFGINADANYKISTVNRQGYKYGNRFTGTLIAYYRMGKPTFSVSPNAGLGYENVQGNLLNKDKVQYTGSNVTNAIAGVEFNFKKIGVGLNAQLPLAQNFAEGQTKLKVKTMAHVTFGF